MEQKIQQTIMVGVFFVVLGFLLGGFLVSPSRQSSPLESRDLAQKPDLPTTQEALNHYTAAWDAFLVDQITSRDSFVKLYFYAQLRVLDKSRAGRIVVDHDGYLLDIPSNSPQDLDSRLQAYDSNIKGAAGLAATLQQLMSDYGGRALFVVYPDRGWIRRSGLPADLQYSVLLEAVRNNFLAALATRRLEPLDLAPLFEAHSDQQLFYKTDHHWTFAGAYLAYTSIMDALGLTALAPSDLEYRQLPNPFTGSQGRYVARVVPSDDSFAIGLVKNQVPYDLTVNGRVLDKTWRYYKLPKSESEPVGYGVYDFAGTGEVVMSTHRDKLPDALVVGDSFKGALMPLLYPSFNVTRQIDLRAYDDMSLLDYVAKHQPDYLIFVLAGTGYTKPPWNSYDKAITEPVSQAE